jgi:hypothetical protein
VEQWIPHTTWMLFAVMTMSEDSRPKSPASAMDSPASDAKRNAH